MIRKYVLGDWYCRWYNYSADDFRNLVNGYKEHDFPLDIMVWIWVGIGWMLLMDSGHVGMYGWTGYSWDKEYIPDPKELLKEFKDDHIYVTLNDHPHDGVRNHEDMYPEFMRSPGKDPSSNINLPFNAGDKNYMEAFFKYGHDPIEKMGVAFWWGRLAARSYLSICIWLPLFETFAMAQLLIL